MLKTLYMEFKCWFFGHKAGKVCTAIENAMEFQICARCGMIIAISLGRKWISCETGMDMPTPRKL